MPLVNGLQHAGGRCPVSPTACRVTSDSGLHTSQGVDSGRPCGGDAESVANVAPSTLTAWPRRSHDCPTQIRVRWFRRVLLALARATHLLTAPSLSSRGSVTRVRDQGRQLGPVLVRRLRVRVSGSRTGRSTRAGRATHRGRPLRGALVGLDLDPCKGFTAVVARTTGSSLIATSSNGDEWVGSSLFI